MRGRRRWPWAAGVAVAGVAAVAVPFLQSEDPEESPTVAAPERDPAAAATPPAKSPCRSAPEPRWQWAPDVAGPLSISPIRDGRLTVATASELVVLDAEDGSVVRTSTLDLDPPLFAGDSEALLEHDGAGGLYVVQLESGSPEFRDATVVLFGPDHAVLWTRRLAPMSMSSGGVIADGEGGLLVPARDYARRADVLYRLDAEGNERWVHHAPRGPGKRGGVEDVSVRDDIVYAIGVVGRDDAQVPLITALDLDTGQVRDVIRLPNEARAWPLGVHARPGSGWFAAGFDERGGETFLAAVEPEGHWSWQVDLEPEGRTSPRAEEYVRFVGLAADRGACMSHRSAPADAVAGNDSVVVWCVDAAGACTLELTERDPIHSSGLRVDAEDHVYTVYGGRARQLGPTLRPAVNNIEAAGNCSNVKSTLPLVIILCGCAPPGMESDTSSGSSSSSGDLAETGVGTSMSGVDDGSGTGSDASTTDSRATTDSGSATDSGSTTDDGSTTDGGSSTGADSGSGVAQAPMVGAGYHTCALLPEGGVRCWGPGDVGRLGYGNTEDIGDDETPDIVGDVDIGDDAVVGLAVGGTHSCVVLETDAVRCWGNAKFGALGYGAGEHIGDDETPATAGDVDVGDAVVEVVVGDGFTCARTQAGDVRCWGNAWNGKLGSGNEEHIGDDEVPASVEPVDLGDAAVQLAAGNDHVCALLVEGNVRCWGLNNYGQLGYGHTETIGDDEVPADAGDVSVGGDVVQLAAGRSHTCARLASGAVRCWGLGSVGRLGYANTETIGDDELPSDAGDVMVAPGASATAVAAGGSTTCAVLDSGALRCWGGNLGGQLGYGTSFPVGDNETPASVGDVPVGALVSHVAVGEQHTCVFDDDDDVRCWGEASDGRLGYGNEDDIGDDETPDTVGPVPL